MPYQYQGPKILALTETQSQTHSSASVAGACWGEEEEEEEEEEKKKKKKKLQTMPPAKDLKF